MMFRCPFDTMECESLPEILTHWGKCLRGRNQMIFFCRKNLKAYFPDTKDQSDHNAICKCEFFQTTPKEILSLSISPSAVFELSKTVQKLENTIFRKTEQTEEQTPNPPVVKAVNTWNKLVLDPNSSGEVLQKSFIIPVTNDRENDLFQENKSKILIKKANEVDLSLTMGEREFTVRATKLFEKHWIFSEDTFSEDLSVFTEIWVRHLRFKSDFPFETLKFQVSEENFPSSLQSSSFICELPNSINLLLHVRNPRFSKFTVDLSTVGNLILFRLHDLTPDRKTTFLQLKSFHNFYFYLKSEVERTEKSLADKSSSLIGIQHELRLRTIESQNFNIEELKKEQARIQSEIKSTKKALHDRKELYKRKIAEYEKDIADQIAALVSKLNDFERQRIMQFKANISTIENDYEARKKINSSLVAGIQAKQQEFKVLNLQLNQIKTRNKKLDQEIEDLRQKITENPTPLPGKTEYDNYYYFCTTCQLRFATGFSLPCHHMQQTCNSCLRGGHAQIKNCQFCKKKIFAIVNGFNMVWINSNT